MNRRTLLAGIASAGLVGAAGCLEAAGLAEHASGAVGVEDEARSETDYELTAVEELTIEESVGALGYSETVVVRNQLTEHEKAVDMGPLGRLRGAVFMVLSTPRISIAGRQVNPVEDKSTEELVDLVVANYDGIDDVVHESDGEVTVLGESTTMSTFAADAEFDGSDVEVYLHVTEAVSAGDDLVVAIGVYPRDLERQERENVVTLMEAVSDDVDFEGEDDAGSDDGESDDAEDGEEDDADGEDDVNDDEGDDEDDEDANGGGDDDEDDGEDDDGLLSV
ncbi:DUF6517 family protein [Natrarchaeobius oligotrophus]|uniref:Uncharacterized protein n=1 Tax=Natrarchaeobius chitinivorans TaxID=1679083 RepID=A0A3N6MP96_NATCH|nr:DUF6517 family protein [Natrarchaeobius chitinivorans]RQG99380.1 hypothetical protein EA472_14225 [Natrarchaeobius chitinivorans]